VTIAPDRHPDHGGQPQDAAQLQRRHPHRPTAGGVAAASSRCAARMDARSPSPNRWCTAAYLNAQSTRAAPVSCDRYRVVHLHKDPRAALRSGFLQPQHCALTDASNAVFAAVPGSGSRCSEPSGTDGTGPLSIAGLPGSARRCWATSTGPAGPTWTMTTRSVADSEAARPHRFAPPVGAAQNRIRPGREP